MTSRQRWIGTLAGLAAAVAIGPAPAGAQSVGAPFEWTGRVGAGKTIEVRGVNGDVRALPASGSEVAVSAERRGTRNDPDEVRIEVVQHEGGVTLCAVYPSKGEPNTCAPGGHGRNRVDRNDVRVDFLVRVPAGVRFEGRTVNGDVDVEGLEAAAEAYTVNGSVRLTTRGDGQASTVNGSITASLGRADWSESREFRSVNGSVTLDLPADLEADFRGETVNGSIDSDFPMTVTGRLSPKRVRGTIGDGSGSAPRELIVSTVNGSIRLRRAPRAR